MADCGCKDTALWVSLSNSLCPCRILCPGAQSQWLPADTVPTLPAEFSIHTSAFSASVVPGLVSIFKCGTPLRSSMVSDKSSPHRLAE